MQRAQTIVEYGLIVATVAAVVFLGAATFGPVLAQWFNALVGHVTTLGT